MVKNKVTILKENIASLTLKAHCKTHQVLLDESVAVLIEGDTQRTHSLLRSMSSLCKRRHNTILSIHFKIFFRTLLITLLFSPKGLLWHLKEGICPYDMFWQIKKYPTLAFVSVTALNPTCISLVISYDKMIKIIFCLFITRLTKPLVSDWTVRNVLLSQGRCCFEYRFPVDTSEMWVFPLVRLLKKMQLWISKNKKPITHEWQKRGNSS